MALVIFPFPFNRVRRKKRRKLSKSTLRIPVTLVIQPCHRLQPALVPVSLYKKNKWLKLSFQVAFRRPFKIRPDCPIHGINNKRECVNSWIIHSYIEHGQQDCDRVLRGVWTGASQLAWLEKVQPNAGISPVWLRFLHCIRCVCVVFSWGT